MPKTVRIDITGLRYGRLIATRFVPDNSKHAKFEFVCDCGTHKIILAQSVVSGKTKSCGCLQIEQTISRQTTHGHAGGRRSPTYRSWAAMMDRSEWGGTPLYEYYGAKGIRVCQRWHSFENFLADMGERPKGTSIDRVDNSKGYSPRNCRWATRIEQALNTSRTRKVKYEGEVIPVYLLCERLGINRNALRSRAVRRGNDYVKALGSFGIECEPCE